MLVKAHQEMFPGEVFLTNSPQSDYYKLGWRTKSIGRIAYDIHGSPLDPINGFFPVFVQRKELEAAGISIEDDRRSAIALPAK